LRIRGGALISTRSFGNGRGGNLTVTATDSIELSGTSANEQFSSGLFSLTTGAGRAGNLRVETGDLRIQDGAQISASTTGAGQGGNVRVLADTIDLSGTSANRLLLSGISSETYSLAQDAGDAGRINLTARELRVRDRAGISTSTFGQGNAGNIIAQVLDRIALSNRGFISSSVAAGAIGNSGSITLRTGSLSATGGSQISAVVSRERRDQQGNRIAGGRGRGGSIAVTASDSIQLSGTNSDGFSSGILTLSERGANGSAGDITLRTGNFRIADGAIVVASTFNDGEGGSIVINANNFEATEGGQVVTSTRGAGNAGEVILNVTGDVSLSGRDRDFQNRRARARRYTNRPGQSDRVSDVIGSQGANSGLFANTEEGSGGGGGSITLNAANLSLTDRATISAQSQGTGNAGNMNLNLTSSVNATDGNIITSTSSENASGGDITLLASDVRLLGDSDIRTDVQGQGGGGNIIVAADYVVAFDDSDILAYSVGGSGGNIVLPAFFGENYFGTNDRSENDSPSRAELNALDGNSQVNLDASGQVSSGTITTPDTSFIQNSLSDLPDSSIDTEILVANSCVVRSRTQPGRFIISGPGNLPQRPGHATQADFPTGTVRSIPDEASPAPDRWQPGDPIVEPQNAYQLEDGRIVLSRECL
jgi:large exoprotein involved in heme utilization and adhesion